MNRAGLKQKLAHEFHEFLIVFLYLAPLFCAFSLYRMLLLHQFGEKSFEYGTDIVNALIIAKVIVIGEYFRLGKRHEDRPLVYSVLYKSFVFTLLVAAFHVLEAVIRSLIHGEGIAAAFAEIGSRGLAEVLARSLVVFFAFIPFFALRETGRVLGERKLADLFFRPRTTLVRDERALRL